MPNMAKKVRVIPPEATLKRRSRKSFRSSIGCATRDSTVKNAAMAATATPKMANDAGDSHPW